MRPESKDFSRDLRQPPYCNHTLEDNRITLERVAMVARWALNPGQGWENNRIAACEDVSELADEVLDRASEQETVETCLKILDNGQDKLVNIAEAVHTGTDEKSEDVLIELNDEIIYNKRGVQSMAQMLLSFNDPGWSGWS